MNRPHVIVSAAMSIDGFLDDDGDERLVLSNPADLDRVDEVRAGVDAIAVGAGTVRADDPRLLVRSGARRAARAAAGEPASPLRVVFSHSGELDPSARLFNSGEPVPIVYTGEAGARACRALMERAAGAVEVVPTGGSGVDLPRALADLAARGVKRLLVEGGGLVHTSFLSADLVDEIHLAVAPFLLGERGGARFVHPALFPQSPHRPLRLVEARAIGEIVLMTYLRSTDLCICDRIAPYDVRSAVHHRTGMELPMSQPEEGPPAAPAEEETQEATYPVDKVVFGISAAVVLVVIVLGALFPEDFERASTAALNWVIDSFGWLFIIAGNAFLVLAVYIAVSRYGNIRLGNSDEEPEFDTLPWISMMFAAGMGIGLMFFGVAEPLTHYFDVPPPLELDPASPYFEYDRQRDALVYSYFHWILHPWAIYAVAGLTLAYSTFRKRRNNSLSAAFMPLTDGRRWGPAAGKMVDMLGIFATVFGTAASLGLGALQVAVGLDIVVGVPGSTQLELIVIGALTAAFVLSAFSGVHRGIKWLSTTNVLLALVIMLFVFVLGPTLFLLDAWPATVGAYLSDLVNLSSITGAFTGKDWMATWTIFYWAWWLSWAPFVGTFIARISRGRSIRQFIVGVLLVPSTASTVWFTVMGGTAIWKQAHTGADYGDAVAQGEEYAMFALLESLPLYSLVSGVSMLLVANYFVTSADSASLVLGSLSSRGSLSPKKPLVVFWGATIGGVAAVLLLSGGLEGLKNATIIVALPFVFVMLLLCVALMKELATDPGGNPMRQQLRHKGFRDAIRRLVGEEVRARSGEEGDRWGRGRLRFGLGPRRRPNQEE